MQTSRHGVKCRELAKSQSYRNSPSLYPRGSKKLESTLKVNTHPKEQFGQSTREALKCLLLANKYKRAQKDDSLVPALYRSLGVVRVIILKELGQKLAALEGISPVFDALAIADNEQSISERAFMPICEAVSAISHRFIH